jgi:hypothetical protein
MLYVNTICKPLEIFDWWIESNTTAPPNNSVLKFTCDDDYFWLSARDCQGKTPNSQNLVEQQVWIAVTTKSRFSNVSMLELMHQEQNNAPIA